MFDDGDRRNGVQVSCIRSLSVASESEVVHDHSEVQVVSTGVVESDVAAKNKVEMEDSVVKAAVRARAMEPGSKGGVGIDKGRETPAKVAADASFVFLIF